MQLLQCIHILRLFVVQGSDMGIASSVHYLFEFKTELHAVVAVYSLSLYASDMLLFNVIVVDLQVFISTQNYRT